ncbi:MAG: hypothetical protein DRI32_03125 [Chloroflexi bacterium]|nr:MAG: hypothetical protein DRI32_03125 [Chloroflexota bacterium]
MNFKQAFESMKSSNKAVMTEFEDLHVDEAEIKFGINTVGEMGNIAIGKVGVGVNYEVTLKWKKERKQALSV